mmetsp:Transcript_32206/g.64108  ORF Transcript_32206/g.64108 Transcript_32206/m.64108 type:complete len:157 (-) Transcript_32206:295-765(-)
MAFSSSFFRLTVFLVLLAQIQFLSTVVAEEVRVEIIQPGNGPPITTSHRYTSHVTLYIENTSNGSKTKAGWSTRQSDGAPTDQPFTFQPGVNLIEGWTEGVLQMNEGERSWLHVPAEKGYGERPMGNPNGGGFYIPGNSDLVFDIEILGKEGEQEL